MRPVNSDHLHHRRETRMKGDVHERYKMRALGQTGDLVIRFGENKPVSTRSRNSLSLGQPC